MRAAFKTMSAVILLSGVAGYALPASAQTTPRSETDAQAPAGGASAGGTIEEIVVTGSHIRGTPLDAALPVEVFTQADLEKQGSPTALEFAKNLTISGPTTGESYYFGGPALTGTVNYNLRGLGADKTLVLLNGRRVSRNSANIPAIALNRVEILKDGAAVIYGADAIGGVVNFITRDHFTGLALDAEYKYIDGSDGDYSAGILGGIGEGDVNFMWSAEYEHRSRLSTLERGFTHDTMDPGSPDYNPAPWSTFTNLAGWVPRGPLPAVPTATADGEFGAPVGGIVSDFTPASCAAVGGRYDNAFTCAYNYIPYYNLVEENDIYRLYAQLNAAIDEDTAFHFDASYSRIRSPQVFGSPSQPIVRGPAMAPGAVDQFYVPIDNPYAAEFADEHGIAGASGFTPVIYRMLAHGGNLYLGEGNGYGVPDEVDNKTWRVSTGLNGLLGGGAKAVGYDFALTYSHSSTFVTHGDTIGYRLQEALNGFGGPDCNAPDLDPARFGTQNPAAAGQGNCMWWNPFSSSFAEQPVLGLSNPGHVAGAENPEELVRWMFDPRAIETVAENLTVDLVFDGTTGIELSGGSPGWAVGIQARELTLQEIVNSDLFNGSTPCPWPDGYTSANGPGSPNLEAAPLPTTDPDFRGCTPDGPGPFVLFAPDPPDHADQQQYSVFGELRLPVLENLNFQAAVRHEEFSGGLGATVYKLAGKWDVSGPLSLRASYGTNYQAPPIDAVPGEVTVAARTYTAAANNWLVAQFVTDADLEPETAKAWNAGAIWQSQGFAPDHAFRLIVDRFDIETKDQIGQIADPNQIASLVFDGPGGTITTCDVNEQPLLARITFNAGCTVGMSGVGTFSSVSTRFGNGPGQSTSGFDVQATYNMPLGPGDLLLDLTATRIDELKTGPTELDGIVISTGDDRLGKLNFATFALAAPELRANFSASYGMDRHFFRLGVHYVSAVEDERPGIQYGENGKDWITTDLAYAFNVTESLTLRATAANLFDRDPPQAQEEFGYDPWTANPLGRTIEVGFRMSL